MIFLRWLLVLVALLIILFQRVDVRVTRGERLTVKISFIFFAVLLTEDKRQKRNFRSISRLLKSIKGVFRSLKFLLAKSDITLYQSKEYIGNRTEKTPIIDLTLHFSLFRLIISAFILLYYIIKNILQEVYI